MLPESSHHLTVATHVHAGSMFVASYERASLNTTRTVSNWKFTPAAAHPHTLYQPKAADSSALRSGAMLNDLAG